MFSNRRQMFLGEVSASARIDLIFCFSSESSLEIVNEIIREALVVSCSKRSEPRSRCSISAKSRTITRSVRFDNSCGSPMDVAGGSENEESMAELDARIGWRRSSAPIAESMTFRQSTKEKRRPGFRKIKTKCRPFVTSILLPSALPLPYRPGLIWYWPLLRR
jgi:hypothetical protein